MQSSRILTQPALFSVPTYLQEHSYVASSAFMRRNCSGKEVYTVDISHFLPDCAHRGTEV